MSTESSPNPYARPYKKKVGPDAAAFGLLIGLVFPILGLLLLYFVWAGNQSFVNYMRLFISFDSPSMMNAASKALSLSMIANLVPFYFFLNRKQYLTVRGILMGMVLLGLMIVLYKFVWQ